MTDYEQASRFLVQHCITPKDSDDRRVTTENLAHLFRMHREQGAEDERESCAKIARDPYRGTCLACCMANTDRCESCTEQDRIAKAIRARGK